MIAMPVIVENAASQTALVDLATLKAVLNIDDDVKDMALSRLIDRASASAVAYLQRPLALQTYRERTRLRGRSRAVCLSVGPIVSIQSITIEGKLLTTLDPLSVARATSRIEDLPLVSACHSWREPGTTIDIVYRAGFTLPGMEEPQPDSGEILKCQNFALPDDIAGGCIETVRTLLHASDRDPLLRSENVEGVGSCSWQIADPSTAGLSPIAQAALDRLSLAIEWMA